MKVEAWLVLRAKRSSWQTYKAPSPFTGQPKVEGATVKRVTVNKPTLDADEIAFRVDMDVDESWFLEGTATIKATVPAQPQATAEIQAHVDMPVKGKAPSPAAQIIHTGKP